MNTIDRRQRVRRRGFNLVEVLIALAITATLLTATLAALDASFRAYQATTEEVSTQSIGRIVMQSMSRGNFDVAWAAIILGAFATIISYLVVTLVERAVIPWYFHLHDEPE